MATAPPTARVTLDDLHAAYGHRLALRQVSASIPKLATTAVVGPNGSGKSTLLSAIAGVIKPTRGRVSHVGDQRPAFVVQRSAVSDALPITVRETVQMGRWAGLGLWRRPSRRDRSAVETALERLDIGHLSGRRLGELSGGQRQRTLVAQGLAQESDLLLLDEPQSGLDSSAQQRIKEVLTELPGEGITVIQVTHDLVAAQEADHCLLLRDGHLTAEGTPSTVLTDQALHEIWQLPR